MLCADVMEDNLNCDVVALDHSSRWNGLEQATDGRNSTSLVC